MSGRNKNSNSSVLAIDWGSQSARCAIYNALGEQLSLSVIEFPPPMSGAAEEALIDAQEVRLHLWQLIRACLNRTTSWANNRPSIDAVAICAQRSGLVSLVDSASLSLANNAEPTLSPAGSALAWHEQQKHPDPPSPPWWIAVPAQILGQGTALGDLTARAPANRLRAFQPEIWRRARYLLPWSTFLNWCLCGEVRDGRSAATGIYPFNFRTMSWHRPVHWTWQTLSSQPRQMAQLQPGGSVAGLLHTQAAEATGLAAGTPLIACGADKACEVFGAGAWRDGDVHISLGTAVCVNRLRQPRWYWNFMRPDFPSLMNELVLEERKLENGFAVVRQLLGLLPARAEPAEAIMDREVLANIEDCPALLCYPQFYQADTQALLAELLNRYPATQVYSALVQGLICQLCDVLEPLLETAGMITPELYISGGGTQGQRLMSSFAHMLQRPLRATQDPQCGLRGAAICAALGARWFESPEEARGMLSPTQWINPGHSDLRYQALHYRRHWQQRRSHRHAWLSG